MEVEMETSVILQPKRDYKAEDHAEVEAEADAAKKRKIEPDAEEMEYDLEWDDSWWSGVDPGNDDIELHTDLNAYQAKLFRKSWDSKSYGSFEAETKITSKRFTDREDGRMASSLQIFSVKVIAIRGGLQWPIDVYGRIAVRDSLDRNRNTIFYRDRNNCQTLTQEGPSLVLTGPVRAVMVTDHVIFEAGLTVKGRIESEDKILSFLAARFTSFDDETYLVKRDYISKLSKLEFTLGCILRSVEATISMRVTHGTWRDDFHGKFIASIDSIKDEQIVLLDSGDKKVPLDGNDILLSRSVVSVDVPGELKVSIEACQCDKASTSLTKERIFTALEMSSSRGEINVGFCIIEVTVAWSLFGPHPDRMHLDLYKSMA